MQKFLLSLVIVVLMVGGAGFANYQRNAPLDAELADRPYARYADGDIEALLAAHKSERDRIRGALTGDAADPTRVMNGFAAGDFDGKIHAFDKFQRKNQAFKQINGMALEHEVEIEVLEKEQNIRKRGLHDPRQRVLRRVLTL
jgi:hypothetical protein